MTVPSATTPAPKSTDTKSPDTKTAYAICIRACHVGHAFSLAQASPEVREHRLFEEHGYRRFLFNDGSLLALDYTLNLMYAVDTQCQFSLDDFEEWLDELKPLELAFLSRCWGDLHGEPSPAG